MNPILRTPMGLHVLRDDRYLSRWIENARILGVGCHEIAAFAHYIPEGGVVINAGACLGDHVAPYAHLVGESGHVYAYESNPVIFSALKKNVGIFNNVTVFDMALGADLGAVSVNLDNNIGASCVVPDADDATKVPCVSLDGHLLSMLSRCDFIHLDAEGYEPIILRGATALIERFRPAMVLECSWHHMARYGETEDSLRAVLDALHYRVLEFGEPADRSERNVLCLPV